MGLDHVGHFKEFALYFKFTERPSGSFKPGSEVIMIYVLKIYPMYWVENIQWEAKHWKQKNRLETL